MRLIGSMEVANNMKLNKAVCTNRTIVKVSHHQRKRWPAGGAKIRIEIVIMNKGKLVIGAVRMEMQPTSPNDTTAICSIVQSHLRGFIHLLYDSC